MGSSRAEKLVHLSPVGRALRAAQDLSGFKRVYNLPLWLFFGGAMVYYTLPRIPFVNKTADLHWYPVGPQRWGFILHLIGVVPGGLLAVFQFLPKIRTVSMLLHRLNGYLTSFLLVLGLAGVLIMTHTSYGGNPASQVYLYMLALSVIYALGKGIIEVRRKHVDKHRRWMLRAWIWGGVILTIRVILIAMVRLFERLESSSTVTQCDEVDDILGNHKSMTDFIFPACSGSLVVNASHVKATVPTNVFNSSYNAEESLALLYTIAICVASLLHVVGVELYIYLTMTRHDSRDRVSTPPLVEDSYPEKR